VKRFVFRKESKDRVIETAGKNNNLKIEGWIQVYIKEMTVVPDAHGSLFF